MRKYDSKLSWLFLWFGIAVTYAVTGRLCAALSAVLANVWCMLYNPPGLSLKSALRWGSSVWPAIFAGELAMGLATGQPLGTASIMAVGNGLDAFLAGWWFHDRLGRRIELDRLRDVVELIAAELLVLQPICTAFGMGALIVTGRMPAHHLGETAAAWYSANLYAEFVTAPAALAWLRWPRPLSGKAQGAELTVLTVLGIAVGVASRIRWDFSPVPLPITLILIFPLLVWGSIRFAPTVAVTMGIALALFSFDAAIAGVGPFQGMSVQERLLSLNVSMSVSIGTGLFLAAAAANERRFEDDQAQLIKKLQSAVEQVSRLEEIVTFCAWTGRVRMGEEWVSVERFLSERYNLNISHGISDEAMKQILRDAGLELPPRLASQEEGRPPSKWWVANAGECRDGHSFIQTMLRKFIARLRETIAPAPKPHQAAPQGSTRPQGGSVPRKAGPAVAARPQGAAPRPQAKPTGQPHREGGSPGRQQEPQRPRQDSRPRADDRRPSGRGPVRQGAGRHSDSHRREGPRARPARDDFEHPGRTPAKPARPGRRAEDGHRVLEAGSLGRPGVRSPAEGLHGPDPHPGAGHPIDPQGLRRDRLGPDRHGKDGGLRAPHHSEARPARRHALPDP